MVKIYHFRDIVTNALIGTLAFELQPNHVMRCGFVLVNPNDVNRKDVVGYREHTFTDGKGVQQTKQIPIIRRGSISKKEGAERATELFNTEPLFLNSKVVSLLNPLQLLTVIMATQGSLNSLPRIRSILKGVVYHKNHPLVNLHTPWSK